jgi:hypothetical protein
MVEAFTISRDANVCRRFAACHAGARRGRVRSAALTAIHAQITPPIGRRLQALGCVLSERGWRVLENASAEK